MADTITAAPEVRPSTASDDPGTPAAGTSADDLVTEELLVEEISIDGMCGVY